MTNQEKLEAVKKYLDEQGIKYSVPKKEDYLCDLFVPVRRMAIHVSNEKDEWFFWKYKNKNPVFIRDEESIEFVLEKVRNTLITHYGKRITEKAKRAGVRPEDYWKVRIRRHKEHLESIQKKEELKKEREKKKAEAESKRIAKKAQEQPKRKRQRIVRYEKVIN